MGEDPWSDAAGTCRVWGPDVDRSPGATISPSGRTEQRSCEVSGGCRLSFPLATLPRELYVRFRAPHPQGVGENLGPTQRAIWGNDNGTSVWGERPQGSRVRSVGGNSEG